MGIIDELAAALAGEQMQGRIAAENPYFAFKEIPDVIGKSAVGMVARDPGRYSTKEAIGTALVSGLLGGALDTMGQNHQNVLTDRYQNVIKNSLFGAPVTNEGLSPSLFRDAKDAASIFKLRQELENVQEMEDFQRQRAAKVQDLLAERGIVPGEEGLTQLFDPVQEEIAKKQGGKIAELEAEQMFYGAGGKNPKSPAYQVEQDAEKALMDLRKDFQGLDSFKQMDTAAKGYKVMLNALKDPSAVADLDFVYGAIQMIEPGMAVREGEQEAVRKSSSIPQEWKGFLQKTLMGQGALTPEIRQGIVRLAQRRYQQHANSFNAGREFYMTEATRRGLPNPASVSSMAEMPSADELSSLLLGSGDGLSPPPPGAATPTPSPMTIPGGLPPELSNKRITSIVRID